jgi:dienelactone hydrolase
VIVYTFKGEQMQLFELLLCIALGTLIALAMAWKTNKTLNLLIILPLLPLLLFEGTRWQLIPMYFLCIIALSSGFYNAIFKKKSSHSTGSIIFAISLMTLSFILIFLFPLFNLPKPGGKYQVGQIQRSYMDENRELFFKSDHNKLIGVSIWYPAMKEEKSKPLPYSQDSYIFSKWISKSLMLPSFLFSHTNLIGTNAYANASMTEGNLQFPVLIYSHALFGAANQNSILFEELASQGFIVISISHTYEAAVTFLEDNEAIGFDNRLMTDFFAETEKIYPLFLERSQSEDLTKRFSLSDEIIMKSTIASKLIHIRAKDIEFIINNLETIQKSDEILNGRLDMSRIGVFGHSLGGASAFYAGMQNEKIKSILNIDGNQYGTIDKVDRTKPFMYITTDAEYNDFNDGIYNKYNSIKIVYENSKHFDFTDIGNFSILMRLMGITGNNELQQPFNQLVVQFFKNTLITNNPAETNLILTGAEKLLYWQSSQ